MYPLQWSFLKVKKGRSLHKRPFKKDTCSRFEGSWLRRIFCWRFAVVEPHCFRREDTSTPSAFEDPRDRSFYRTRCCRVTSVDVYRSPMVGRSPFFSLPFVSKPSSAPFLVWTYTWAFPGMTRRHFRTSRIQPCLTEAATVSPLLP